MITFNDFQQIFNRAWSLAFIKSKLLLAFGVLALCGILLVFFRGISIHAIPWVSMSLIFLPLFLCAGILLSMGVILIRVYHHEIKGKPVKYKELLSNSWEVIIGTSYFAIPIILGYLLLWMLLGLFILLNQLPGLGSFFSVILAFGPFLLNLGSLILCIISLAMLFYITPIVALTGLNKMTISQTLFDRLRKDVFLNLVLVVIALLPLFLVVRLLMLAANLTGTIFIQTETSIHTILQWFFIMLPFVAILAPTVVFFFNFAAEAHVLCQKLLRKSR